MLGYRMSPRQRVRFLREVEDCLADGVAARGTDQREQPMNWMGIMRECGLTCEIGQGEPYNRPPDAFKRGFGTYVALWHISPQVTAANRTRRVLREESRSAPRCLFGRRSHLTKILRAYHARGLWWMNRGRSRKGMTPGSVTIFGSDHHINTFQSPYHALRKLRLLARRPFTTQEIALRRDDRISSA